MDAENNVMFEKALREDRAQFFAHFLALERRNFKISEFIRLIFR